ncbi:hypothetical protein N9933_03710 [bacterium]|nr:hypothetical protein [bacterium]
MKTSNFVALSCVIMIAVSMLMSTSWEDLEAPSKEFNAYIELENEMESDDNLLHNEKDHQKWFYVSYKGAKVLIKEYEVIGVYPQ